MPLSVSISDFVTLMIILLVCTSIISAVTLYVKGVSLQEHVMLRQCSYVIKLLENNTLIVSKICT